MNSNWSHIIFIFSGLLCLSCLDPIEFDVPNDFTDSLVVQGRIIKSDPSFIEVSIQNLFDFSAESRQPIGVDRVVIQDDLGQSLEIRPSTPGTYFQELNATSILSPEVGRSYKIIINRTNGDVIESDLENLPATQVPRNLNLSTVEQFSLDNVTGDLRSDEFIALSVDTEADIENDQGLLWEVRSRFRITDSGLADGRIRVCYLNRKTNVSDIHVLDPDQFSSGVLNDVELLTIPINSFLFEGYYFQVNQFALTPTAFAYWNGVDILSEREGQPFDVPVGEVVSNLNNTTNPEREVFGYFFAAEQQTIYKLVEEEFFEGMILPHCPAAREECQIEEVAVPTGCRCGLCCDCRDDPGSSEIRPDFFL